MDALEYNKLKLLHEQVESLTKSGTWELDIKQNKFSWSDGAFKMLGYKPQEFEVTFEKGIEIIHPEDRERATALMDDVLQNDAEYFIEKRLFTKAGNIIHVRTKANLFKDEKGNPLKLIGVFQDISEFVKSQQQSEKQKPQNQDISHHFLNEKLDELEKELMEESIKAEKPIHQLLHNYLSGFDSLFQGMKSSTISIENNKLKNLSSPGLPHEYLEEIENLSIGLNQGSCGTAAYLKQQVVVKDIFNDERWEGYTELGTKYGFKSCWSEPIFNNKGEVIATFAIYHDVIKEPKDLEINIFERGARLISMLIQNFAYIQNIQESNERFKYINKATNNAVYDWNITNDHSYWGNSLTRVFGHRISNGKFRLKDWAQWIHPDDLEEVLQNLDIFLAKPEESNWLCEYRFINANGQYAYVEDVGFLIRDKNGQPLRMIGALKDQTQFKQEQLKQELQYELSQFFKTGEPLDRTLRKSVKYLSEFGHYPAGEIWLLSQNQEKLHLSAFYVKGGNREVFYQENSKKIFEYGEGLPGTVWKTLKNEVWNNIDQSSNFIRQNLAEKANLKSATAYPLFYQEIIVGVMVFFSDEELKAYEHNVMFYNNLKHYLGAEIIRKRQEEELHLFFDNAPEILAIATSNGKFAKVNPAFSKLLGYSQQELTSKPFKEFIHPNDLNKTITEYDESLKKKRITNNFTNRYITKSGDYKWISWNSSKVYGEEEYFFAYGRDVTETVELQQTVENASKLAKVGGWEINQETGEHFWSQMTKEIHEVPEDFTPNLDEAINFYHPRFQERVTKAVERAIENGESFDFEAVIITHKGNEKWVRAIGNAEMRDGKCVRIYGSFQDINDRKRAEIRLENISNNIPGVIFQYHLKPNGADLMNFVSKGSEEIFGYSPEESVQNNERIWKNIEAGGDLTQMKEAIMESANNLSNWHASWRYQHPDGNIYWHEGFGHPMKKPDGTILWDSVIVDITDKRKAEKEIELANLALKKYARDLEISNAELEQFAYVASHDLQEPLRMVSGFLTQLEKKYGEQLDEKANQYINFAVDGAKRMRQIILDLLDYSKIGKMEEEITEVNLNEVIHEVCLLQRKQIEELSVNVEFKDLPTIIGHPFPMIQIFSNLISNAIKYSHPDLPPKIIIKAHELKNEWRFSVKDNGIGIEEEYFDRIFNIFQRLHNKNEYSGTGMGLAIVKKIVENLNGRIWVKSNIGKGSTFYFTIPKS